MAGEELLAFDISTLSEKLHRRELSPLEVIDAYLARIEATEPKLNAYITVTADIARAAARELGEELANGRWRGPLHGVPVALKDLCYTKGVRTTGGSKILGDFVPEYDATVWARLRDGGAILLGKLNLHEFAAGGSSNNPHFGAVHNPYDLARIAGGSSGGSSAALSAHSALASIGTDTGGSIRMPAALAGCVGLKPTYGRVSRFGVIPLAHSVDHVGPMTRSVRDAALMLNAIAGHDVSDATSSVRPVVDYTNALTDGIEKMRIGVVRELCEGLHPEVEKSFNAALETLTALGASVEEISIPYLGMSAVAAARTMVVRAESFDFHQRWVIERPEEYGADVRRLVELGMTVPAVGYVRSQRARMLILAQSEGALEDHDVLVSPTCAITAPLIGEERVQMPNGDTISVLAALSGLVAPFNGTGQPVIAVPSEHSSAGLPISLQIIGRAFDEATILRAAYAYEQARGPLPEPQL